MGGWREVREKGLFFYLSGFLLLEEERGKKNNLFLLEITSFPVERKKRGARCL